MEKKMGAPPDITDELADISVGQILSQTTLPAAIVTREGEFAYINGSALEHLGSPERGLSEQYNAFTLPSFQSSGMDRAIKETLAGEKIERAVDYLSMWGKRTKAWIEYIPLRGRGEQAWGVLLLIHPKTAPAHGEQAVPKLEAELEIARMELRQMHDLQQRFIAMVSHELRTPLVPLLGYLQMLEKEELGELSGSQAKAVGVATRGARRLLDLVESVLAMSRGTGEDQTVELGPVDACEALREAADAMLPVLEESGLHVDVHCEEKVPEVMSNRAKLVEILTTLLDNAEKFSDENGRVELVATRASEDRVALIVANTGKTIPLEERKRIFDFFYQAERPETRSRGGLGLGLAIVKETLLAQGGSIEVVDWKDFDAAFRVELPVITEAIREGKRPKMSYRVLLADLSPDRKRRVSALAERLPATLKTCANADEARELMRSWPPTVLLLSLDDEAAIDLVHWIREESPRPLLPVIMLTSEESERLRRKALDNGATAVITDPGGDELLLRIFRSIYPAHF